MPLLDTGPFAEKPLVLVHVPKCAGTSLKKFQSRRQYGYHLTYRQERRYFPERKAYSSVAVVRDPWSRVVSNYDYARQPPKNKRQLKRSYHPDFRILEDKSFEQAIDLLCATVNPKTDPLVYNLRHITNTTRGVPYLFPCMLTFGHYFRLLCPNRVGEKVHAKMFFWNMFLWGWLDKWAPRLMESRKWERPTFLKYDGWLPCSNWVVDKQGRLSVDEVILGLEDLKPRLQELVGGEFELPHIHKSQKSKEPKEYYSKESFLKVAEFYREDVLLFGFREFGGWRLLVQTDGTFQAERIADAGADGSSASPAAPSGAPAAPPGAPAAPRGAHAAPKAGLLSGLRGSLARLFKSHVKVTPQAQQTRLNPDGCE